MEEVFQLQAIFGLTVAIFEVPSGYLCDLWGRKKTISIGTFFYGVGFSLLLWADSYWSLVFYEIVLGIALSLFSGADVSILYDLLKENESHDRETFTKAMADRQLAAVSGESIASILGGLAALVSWKLVIILQATFGWVPFLVSLTLREPKYQKMSHESHWDNFREIVNHIFMSNRLLRLVFINLGVWGLATFIAVWMFQKHWQQSGIEIGYFGLIWAAYNLSVGVVGKFVPFLEQKIGALPLLIALGILPVLGYGGLALFSGWLGVLLGFLFQVSRGLTQIILKDALNWRVPSQFRATVNSLSSLFFRLGFALVGPVVGYLIDRIGLTMTSGYLSLVFFVIFLATIIPLLIEVKRQQSADHQRAYSEMS
jgi:MFS family permease